MTIILKPRRHSRLWREEEKRGERRENAAAAAGAPTLLGAFCFFCGAAREFGATVANLRAAPGGRIKWGGIYLLNPTFYPRSSPMDEAIKSQ